MLFRILMITCFFFQSIPAFEITQVTRESGNASTDAHSKHEFVVASIHESHSGSFSYIENPAHSSLYFANHVSLMALIMSAYELRNDWAVSGLPRWGREKHFDLQAKSDESTDQYLVGLTDQEALHEKRLMLRSVVADCFKLRLVQRRREGTVYELRLPKRDGIRLGSVPVPSIDAAMHDESYPSSCGKEQYSRNGRELIATECSLKSLISYLKMATGAEVVDQTQLSGRFRFDLRWGPEQVTLKNDEAAYPSIVKALSEQTGLELHKTTGLVTVWDIEHVELPTDN